MSEPGVTPPVGQNPTPPPADPPVEDLPWGETPPVPGQPAETPAPAEGGDADGETEAPLPWGEQPAAATFVRQPWMPELRWGLGGSLSILNEGLSGAGRLDVYWANPNLIWRLNLGPLPAPVHFYPRIETTISPDYQTLTGGLAIHLLDPDRLSIYANLMGGVTFSQNPMDELEVQGNFSTGLGAQVRIPIRSPILLPYVEYNRQWIEPLQSHEIFLGMRLQI